MILCVVIASVILYKLEYNNNFKIKNIDKNISVDSNLTDINSSITPKNKEYILEEVKEEDLNLSFLGDIPKIQDINTSHKIDENSTILKDENLTLANDLNSTKYEILDQNLTKENTIEKNKIDENTTKKDNKKTIKNTIKKAKLAIIVDDMANKNQVDGFKKLNLKLNPSFFPPDKSHPHTPKYSQDFEFFMVHLPLAAINYNKPELDTLHPNDNKERIKEKIKKIKQDFKNIRYINNHTGSLFTKDEKAMQNLYEAFSKYNIDFIDSKTIGSSKAHLIADKLNRKYIKRDIFLDNEDDVNYVKNQISKAVALAKKNGFAIAICHPRKNTFKALEESKDLLKSVELVYISELYGN